MDDHYTAAEIASILGRSKQATIKRANREEWPAIKERYRGGKRRKYVAAQLPQDVREAIEGAALERALADPGVGSDREDRAAAPRACAPATTEAGSGRVIVPERSDQVGLAKYQLVTAWRKAVRTQSWRRRGAATEAFLLAYNCGQLLPQVYDLVGTVSDKTLYRLNKKLKDSAKQNGGAEDYRVLCDGRGGWKKHGTTRWRRRDLSREAQEAFLRCYLHPNKPSVKMAVQATHLVMGKAGRECAEEWTFRRWLKDFERRHWHVCVLAREGEKTYKDKVAPYITRDPDLLRVGEVLVADGHDINFFILHPQTGKPVRMKLIMFFDWASRMPCGWQIMPTENSVAISGALYNSIIYLGKTPDIVYLDNGKAFKAKVFTDTNPDFEMLRGIYGRLGIATIFADPYNARSKVIERFFRTVGLQLETLVPSYCGGSIEHKPAWMSRNEKFHQAWHEARTAGWIPNVREAAHLMGLYFDWYACQPHEGLGGRTPRDVFSAGRGPGVDERELAEQFLWTQEVTPRRCRVTLYGIEYEAECLYGLRPDKKSVIARYSTADLSKIHCYLRDTGEYLGEAHPVQALNPIARIIGDEVGVDQVKAALKHQRKLAKQAKESLTSLGVGKDQVDSLNELPWNKKAAVLPGGKTEARVCRLPAGPEESESISAEERARLELVVSRAEEEIAAEAADNTAPDRPEYFSSQVQRYEWCFRARHEHGYELTEADAAFLVYYEAEPEFEDYRQYYADLRELFALYATNGD